MQKVFSVISILLVGGVCMFAQESDLLNSRVRDLTRRVELHMPESYRYPEAFIDSSGWRAAPEFLQLSEILKTQWMRILPEIQKGSLTETSQVILFAAAQRMPVAEYVRFLDAAADLVKAEKIKDARLLKWGLLPQPGCLSVTKRYKDPAVRKLLEKIRSIFGDDSEMGSYLTKALSGDVK